MGELGVLIPIIALMIPIVVIWTKHKRQIEAMRMEHETRVGGADELASRLARIEDRLAVLERIATDKSSGLSDEIEALRRRA